MSEPAAADQPPSRSGRIASAGSIVVFPAAAAGLTLFWVGDLSEQTDPRYADHLWRPWAFLVDHEPAVGIVSMVVLVLAGTGLALARRAGRMPPPRLAQVVVVTAFAVWLGLGYRVLTAGVTGANIGGGGVLLLTPVLALITVALVVGMAVRASRQRAVST